MSDPQHDVIVEQDSEGRLRVWEFVKEPRILSSLMIGFYLYFLGHGIWTYLDPPQTAFTYFQDRLDPELVTAVWPLCWAIGGLLGGIGVTIGHYWLEKPGLLLVMGGQVIYYGVTLEAQASGSGSRAGALTVIGALGFLALYRWTTIYLHDINPDKA